MPQVFKIGGYLVYFWLNEGDPLEPVQVHVAKGMPVKNGTKIWLTKTGNTLLCQDILGDLFLPVSRGLIVNVDFIRQLDTKSCTLKDGRKILLSRKNQDKIHSAYAAYVFSQLKR